MGVINPFRLPQLPIIVVSCFSPLPIPLAAPVFWNFWKNGFNAHLLPITLSDMRNVEVFASHVVSYVLKNSKGGRVNLTGFSMGGVAGLFAIKRLGLSDRVASFVSVAAPFNGSPFGYLGPASVVYSVSGRQMQPSSKFLSDLHADPLPVGPRYVSISGDRDRVCPFPTAKLDGAENIVLPSGHLNTLIDLEIHSLVASFFI